jgi:hypothetical protein
MVITANAHCCAEEVDAVLADAVSSGRAPDDALHAGRADSDRFVQQRVNTETNTENTEQDLLGVLGC